MHVCFFWKVFKGNITRVMTWLVSKIDYFQVLFIQVSLFSFDLGRGKKGCVVRRLEDWAPAGSKDCVRPSPRFKRQQNGVEQLTDTRRRRLA